MTTHLTYVKELLSTADGTQGTLLIPRRIAAQLVQETEKMLIPRELASISFGPNEIPGSSIDVNSFDVNSANARLVAEGAEFHLNVPSFSNTNIRPLKYGLAVQITREMMEDSQFPLLQEVIRYAAKKIAENENSLLVTTLTNGAGNTTSGGANVTIANITAAMQNLETNDFKPTHMLCGVEVVNDLRNIDTFAEADKFGSREMMQNGMVGTVYGMPVMAVSTNAGMTATTAFIIDRSEAYYRAEKRPVTVENFTLPLHDMEGAVISQRIAFAARRSNAIARITSS